jgi:hypothetical protein
MAIGAAGHSLSTACMPTTSLSFVMVDNHLVSTMVSAFAHRITKSKRSRLERAGSNHQLSGGYR